MKIAVTEKNQYTKKLQQKLRENEKHIKIALQQNHTHTHTQNHLTPIGQRKEQKKGRAQESPIVVPSSISTCNNSRVASFRCN